MARVSDDLAWVVSRLEPEHELASRGPGQWNVREVLAHMVMYEERYTLPALELMAAGSHAAGLDITRTESDLQHPAPGLVSLSSGALLERMGDSHARAAALVTSMTDADFLTPRRSLWGPQSPLWIVEKSWGHHWEHGVTVFHIVLFHQFEANGLRAMSRDEREQLDSFT
jgi:hypothetical protein